MSLIIPDFFADGGKLLPAPPVPPPPGLPPTPPGPPGEPVFLLRRLLKKLARTPSDVAPATRGRRKEKPQHKTNTDFLSKYLFSVLINLNKHIKASRQSNYFASPAARVPSQEKVPFILGSIFFDPVGIGVTLATFDVTDLFGVLGDPPGTLGEASY